MIKLNKKTGELYLYGVVGDLGVEEYFNATDVVVALREIGDRRATVHINSPGGIADQGIAIYNVLKAHSAGVDTVNDSLAASAASVIFLAGEQRTASEGSRVMIHKAMGGAFGNSDDMERTAEQMKVYDNSLVEIYSQYMPSGTPVLELMSRETWYNSIESVSAGLANKSSATTGVLPVVAAWLKNAPEDLTKLAPARIRRHAYNAFCSVHKKA